MLPAGFSNIVGTLRTMQSRMIERENLKQALPTRTFATSWGFNPGSPHKAEFVLSGGKRARENVVHGVASQTPSTQPPRIHPAMTSCTHGRRRSNSAPLLMSKANTAYPSPRRNFDNTSQPENNSKNKHRLETRADFKACLKCLLRRLITCASLRLSLGAFTNVSPVAARGSPRGGRGRRAGTAR